MSDRESNRGGGQDRELDCAVAALPREIQPTRDLWPGIESRIAGASLAAAPPPSGTGPAPWRPWLLRLAAAVTLMLASSLATLWYVQPRTPAPAAEVAEARAPGEAAATAEGDASGEAFLPPEYLLARFELSMALEQNLEQLTPQTQRIVERNLREIRRGLEEISAALARDPSNPTLQRLLLAATEQELRYMSELRRMTENRT